MQPTELVPVQFHGQTILAVTHDGKPYVAMQPICENIGLHWGSQYNRIQRNHVLKSTIFITKMVAEDGKQRDMVCLPLSMLNGWLFGVDANRVKDEIRPKLIRYQLECFDVLHQHFIGNRSRFSVSGALYAKAMQAEKAEAASFALASIAGKSLRQRRKEKKELAELLTMLREEVQLRLLLGHII